jgi:effector-binding domain-containing protein
MKTLKLLIGTVAICIIALVVVSMIAPKSATVQRTVTINAPAGQVMQEVNSLEKMQNWSPWAERDPNMKITYEGSIGKVGSVSRWEGNKDVGKGEQKITNITENGVETQLSILKPWKTEANIALLLEPEGDRTKATWSFTTNSLFPWNAMMIFMNIDDMLGKDFEYGLNKLKQLVETKAGQEPPYTIEVVQLPKRVYIAKRDSIAWEKLSDYYNTYLPQLYESVGKNKLQPTGAATGIYYVWDEENQFTVLAAAVPVMGDEKTKVQGFETIVLPSGRALKLVYHGPYEGTEKAHRAMDTYIREKSMQQTGPVIEEYVTDPASEPDTSRWQTIIYYPVQ